MDYINPGAAFSHSLGDFMLQQSLQKRQALLDSLAVKRENRLAQAELDTAQERRDALREHEADRIEKANDRKVAAVEKIKSGLVRGDVLTPDFLEKAQGAGVPMPTLPPEPAPTSVTPPEPPANLAAQPGPTAPEAPTPTPRGALTPPAIRFGGNRQENELAAKQAQQQTIRKGLADAIRGGADPTEVIAQYLEAGGDPKEAEGIVSALRPKAGGGEIKETPTGWVRINPDNTVTPISGATPYHPPKEPADTGWTIQKITNKATGEEQIVRVNSRTGESHPVEGYMPNLPEQQRARKFSARQVVSHFDTVANEIKDLDNQGALGPLAGRGTEFLAGRIGSAGNPETDRKLNKLRIDLLLIKSGTTMVHFGSRGGQQYIDKMNSVLDSGKMSKDELLGALDGAAGWLNGYARDPRTADELMIGGDEAKPAASSKSKFEILSVK